MTVDFRAVVSTGGAPVAVIDRERRYVYVNAALEATFGAREGLLGTAFMAGDGLGQSTPVRQALDEVFERGRAASFEQSSPVGETSRRWLVRLTPLAEKLAVATWTDITELSSLRLLASAARAMTTGMVIVEAPSGRVSFKNEQTDHIFGLPRRAIQGVGDYEEAFRAYDAGGRRLESGGWPITRALAGHTVVDERIELERDGDELRRIISIDASPVRDDAGNVIAAVSTYHDVSKEQRSHEAASCLAAAGALLERFDPATSLQAIVDLAVPALADWCCIHLAGARPRLAALAHFDAEQTEVVRSRMEAPSGEDTAVARVLAGSPGEPRSIDVERPERAARTSDHLGLAADADESVITLPFVGRDGVLGAITFAMARSGRHYRRADLETLRELTRRTGVALDTARLLDAERLARRNAEQARDRTRQLQALTEVLSRAIDESAVIQAMVGAGREAMEAGGGLVWMLRDDRLELAPETRGVLQGQTASFRTIPVAAALPVCEVVRTLQPLMFESRAAMLERFPLATPSAASTSNAWAVMPMVTGGRGIGGVVFSFERERTFSADDRELLKAMIGQVSLALDRCRLLEAERRGRAREQQLHQLSARLSSALTPGQVANIACDEVIALLGAYSGAAAIRAGDQVRILGTGGPRDERALARVADLPLDAAVPVAEAVKRSELVWCATEAELALRYAHLEDIWRGLGLRAWGAVPFAFEGRTVGSLAVSFQEERVLSEGERQFLQAASQVAAQALERARLYETLSVHEEQLRSALGAAHAGAWHLDLSSVSTAGDISYDVMLGMDAGHGIARFAAVHPKDRPSVQAQFERTLRDGSPYEPEFRVQREDGTYLWVRAHARLRRGPSGEPTALAGVLIDIDEAKRASLQAEKQRHINETLHRLAASFARELEQDRLIQLVSDEVRALVGASACSFLDARGERLARSLGPDAAVDGVGVSEAPDLLARSLRSLRPEHGALHLGAGSNREPRHGSSLAVPVVAGSGDVLGVLLLAHPDSDHFGVEREQLASNVASQAAVALENARLYRTVREQKEQLEAAVERARLADRRKDEFLAMLGHELRNPVAPIVTALSLMDLKGGGFEREREVIRRQLDHLVQLVDDLLDVARITRGKIQLSLRVVDLQSVLTRAVEAVSPLLQKRMQRLEIEGTRSGLEINADPMRLAQVFQNVLTNASKYSDIGATLVLRAGAFGDQVRVEVEDPGVGITAEMMPRLFEPFAQGDRTIDRAQGGLGIGLTIAKSLCDLHAATIEAFSEGAGRGSTFTVTLPRAASVRPEADSSRGSAPLAHTAQPQRILVVDDNVDAALTLEELLQALGHEVAVAHDGQAALDVASSFQPRVALLDIGLPVMDGYELARRLRERDRALRLIAITGYGQEDDRRRAREAGFDHHLVKPIDPRALLALLAT